jgi:hypothetical protein
MKHKQEAEGLFHEAPELVWTNWRMKKPAAFTVEPF